MAAAGDSGGKSGGRIGREYDTDPDATAATMVDGPRSVRATQELERGKPLGRYIVLGPLGRGGMGLVYKAYDPELDRRVALKLVRLRRERRSSTARERLLREAQALAQLAHPNVVAVYDVGSIESGDLFIAMELVEGQTLREWLAAKPRELREILAVFIATGRGLEAAHEAGLVHRDFKPDNIIIGADGRARVIDFGLARTAGVSAASSTGDHQSPPVDGDDEPSAPDDDSEITGRSGRGLSAPLTIAGSIVGTPAYMAPEQHRGNVVDARSDQFSFCVTLWRAVYGSHPFAATDADGGSENIDDVDDMIRKLGAGELEPGDTGKVPSWLRSILVRGLSVEPGARYESMTPLLTDLGRDPAALRRRLALAGVVGAVACALVFGVFARDSEAPEPCRGGDARLAAVWGAGGKAAIARTFSRLRGDDGARSAEIVASAVTEYGRRWVAMYTEACRATAVLGEQSDELLDRRMACLDRKLEKVDAMISVFSAATRRQVTDEAVVAVASLPALASCADGQALTAITPPPEDEATRALVADAGARIDRLEAMLISGDVAAALKTAEDLAAEAKAIGYPPLTAEALFLHGVALRKLNKGAEAEKTLYAAVLAAAAAKDDDRIAQIWVEVLWVIGYTQKRIDDGLAMRTVVEAAVTRSGDMTRRADMMNNVGALLRKKGDFDGARDALEKALEIWKKSYGDKHLQVSKAHNNLGNVLTDMGRYREGRDHHQRVVAIREAELGTSHPATASSYNNLGNALLELGEYASARDAYQRALAIYEKLDPEAGDVTMALNNLGSVLAELGDVERARELQLRSIEIQKRTLSADDAELGISINNLADIELKVGNNEEALVRYMEARAIWTRGVGANHTYVGYATTGVGFALIGLERWAEALAELNRALALWKAAHGDDHPPASAALLGVGLAEIGGGRPRRAIAPLERAAQLRAAGAPTGLAEVRFALARALSAAGRDPTRVEELADQARAAFKAAPASADRVHEIDDWRRGKRPSSGEAPQ